MAQMCVFSLEIAQSCTELKKHTIIFNSVQPRFQVVLGYMLALSGRDIIF